MVPWQSRTDHLSSSLVFFPIAWDDKLRGPPGQTLMRSISRHKGAHQKSALGSLRHSSGHREGLDSFPRAVARSLRSDPIYTSTLVACARILFYSEEQKRSLTVPCTADRVFGQDRKVRSLPIENIIWKSFSFFPFTLKKHKEKERKNEAFKTCSTIVIVSF